MFSSENVLITKFFVTFNYPWTSAVSVFASRIAVTLKAHKKTCWWFCLFLLARSINGLLLCLFFWVMKVVSGGNVLVIYVCQTFVSFLVTHFAFKIYGSLCNFTFVQLSPSHPTLHRQVPGFRQYPFCLLHPGLQMAIVGQLQINSAQNERKFEKNHLTFLAQKPSISGKAFTFQWFVASSMNASR